MSEAQVVSRSRRRHDSDEEEEEEEGDEVSDMVGRMSIDRRRKAVCVLYAFWSVPRTC